MGYTLFFFTYRSVGDIVEARLVCNLALGNVDLAPDFVNVCGSLHGTTAIATTSLHFVQVSRDLS